MSTAVAEARPAYGGFPGSGKRTGVELPAGKRRSDGFFIEEDEADEEVLTEENSSIGAPSLSSSSIGENSASEAGGDEGEDEVESKLREGDGLGCLDALEDSLPIKSGLSSFYSGKSKSFTSLAEATSTVAAAKELAKLENPFNKRRRILANWSRRASCSSLATATTYLPPLLAPDHAVAEGNEGEEDDSDDDYEYNHLPHRGKNGSDAPALPLPPARLGAHRQMGLARKNGHGTFRSPRSFSLSDLQNSSDNSSS